MAAGGRDEVWLSAGAEADLDDIVGYIAVHDSPAKAGCVLDPSLKAAAALAIEPDRGSRPREPLELGIRDFRQTFFKPCHPIDRVIERAVIIVVIADGRRDMRARLERRLLTRP